MWILALDSATEAGSAALLEDGILRAQILLRRGNTHSKTLLPSVERLLGLAEVSLTDIGAFACTTGPGSFTGLRIGISTVKGLAFGTGKPCYGVSALECQAHLLRGVRGRIVPALDARRDQVYTACFLSDGDKVTRRTPDSLLPVSDLNLDACGGEVYVCGDAADRLKELWPRVQCPAFTRTLYAAPAGEIAWQRYSLGIRESEEDLHPVYLRVPQAEETRLKSLKKSDKT